MLEKIKQLFAALLIAGFATQTAFAESLNQDDMAFAFGNSSLNNDLGEIALLSDQEMMETEGEFFPFIYGTVFAARFAYTGYRVWRATRTGAQIYSKGWHRAHHNFGTRANPSWRNHYQWTTSQGNFRVPYGNHYLYRSRPDLGYRPTWFRP